MMVMMTHFKLCINCYVHVATVDMTTDGVEETTVVTAMEEGLVLGKTTVCFWAGVVKMEVEPSLDMAALLWAWDLDRMLGTKLELGEVVTMIT